MRNRYRTIIKGAVITAAVLAAAGCSRKTETEAAAETSAETALAVETAAESSEAAAEETKAKAAAESTSGTASKAAANAPEASEETTEAADSTVEDGALFERFLKNEEPVYFERYNISKDVLDSDGNPDSVFDAEKGYSLQEMLKELQDNFTEEDESEAVLSDCEYGTADCGLDGNPELVLKIGYDLSYGTQTELLVLKPFEGKLQLCYEAEYAYRTFADINSAGFVSEGGSVSAAESIEKFGVLGADGSYCFDYGISTDYANASIQTAMEQLGAAAPEGEMMRVECVYFDPMGEYEMLTGTGDSCIYTWFVTKDYEDSDDPAVYEADSCWSRAAAESGIDFVTHEERDAALQAHEKELGITDDVRNADAVDWQQAGI